MKQFGTRFLQYSLTPRMSSVNSSRGLSTSISAAVARGVKTPFAVEQVQLRDPKPDEVLVKVVATGLCHTDIAVKERNLCSFPIVLGHEGTGVVEAVGSAVRQLQKGDHVLMSYASCGACPHCAQGKPAYCYDHGSLNFSGTHPDGSVSHSKGSEKIYGSFFQQSSLATHALVPERSVLKVNSWVRPAGGKKPLDLATLAPLGCGVQTGAGAVINTLKATAGSKLAIFGCGGVGLSAILAAKVVGCSHVVAVDMLQSKLDVAKSLGATHTVLVAKGESPADISKRVKDAASAQIGVDFALDTTGNPSSLRSAFDSLRPLGVAGLIGGSTPGTEVSVNMLELLPGKQLRGVIQGDAVPQVFLPQLLDLYAQGRFPFDKLITFYDGLESINQAFDDAHKGKVIKPVIRVASA